VIDWNKVVELFEAEQALGKGVGCAHAALSCSLDGWGRFFSSLLGRIDIHPVSSADVQDQASAAQPLRIDPNPMGAD
ncbi:hypothetical protein, partial [Vandammella animalimorsus]|uniref:hypothetical protein n=1 Tax=Vandammella animalimorsus TaxID=2029117 RepID=UPI001EED0E10